MNNSDFWDAVIAVVCALGIFAAWGYWVHQRDVFIYSVMDCMADMSEQEYNRCAEEVTLARN